MANTKHKLLALSAGIALTAASAFSPPAHAAPTCPGSPIKVTEQTAFLLYAGNVASFVADQKGFFKDAGLAVSVIGGNGAAATASNVDQGTVTFGESDFFSVVIGRSKGMKIKSVALLTEGTTQAFGTLDPAIKTPKDFEGRTVGLGSGTGDWLLLPVLMKLNDADIAKVKLINMTPAAYASSLMNGQIDVTSAYLDGSFVSDTRLAKEQGKTMHAIAVGDYHMDIYRQNLIASEKTITENPCLIHAFVGASMKGLHYAVEHPDEAAAIVEKAVPTVNQADVPAQIADLVKVIDTPAFRKNGFGVADPEKMKKTVATITEATGTAGIDAAQVYTNEFVK